MADLTTWQEPAPADRSAQARELYELLANIDGAELVTLINERKLPPGTLGQEAKNLARGLDEEWAGTIASYLLTYDQVISEAALTSDQPEKQVAAWLMEILHG